MARRGNSDFDPKVISVLAERAAMHCSNPDCGVPTTIPSDDPSKAIRRGVAAHITAAAAGGARYDATLTDEQRRSAENGIHLCASCSVQVDKNGGADYSVERLRGWKQQREEAVRLGPTRMTELAGSISAHGQGTVTGAEIQGPTRIMPGTRISASGVGSVTGVKVGPKK